MGQLTDVYPQNSFRFHLINLFTNAISRFTTISMGITHSLPVLYDVIYE